MRIKALVKQHMFTLVELHKTLPPQEAMRLLCSLQSTIELYKEIRNMKDLSTSTLDGAAGFERCRSYSTAGDRRREAGFERCRWSYLMPTDRELRQEEQEEQTENEPA